jgi:tetratricopeptide (TPR) repeat protein
MKSGNPLLYILREEFESFSSSPKRVEVCESIARCFHQLGQYDEAAHWYETAGRLVLSEAATSMTFRALSALAPYEQALECYREGDDEDKVTECSTMLNELRRACASA